MQIDRKEEKEAATWLKYNREPWAEIETDFELMHPGKDLLLLTNWDTFYNKVELLKKSQVGKEDPILEDILNKPSAENSSTGGRCALQLAAIGRLIPPKGRIIQKEKNHWKFSVAESVDTIFISCMNHSDVENIVVNQKEKALKRKISYGEVQPYIILVGPQLSETTTAYVVVDKILFKHTSVLKALDILFKTFIALDLKYPPPSEHIHTLIQKVFHCTTGNMSKTRQQSQSSSEGGLSEEMIAKICKQQAGMIGKQIEDRFKQFESSLKSIFDQVSENKSKIQILETKMEHCERMYKMKNLIIYGEQQAANETPEICENKMMNFFKEKLEHEISSSEIEQCYRIGKVQNGKPRPILVQFLSIKTKNHIFNKKKMLRNSNYFMKEDLTKSAVEMWKSASEKLARPMCGAKVEEFLPS
ncbi:unnamed protein product [Phaedon cochleariae]|uniref:Uncharacterized protein n=1 Tax=Phaedon cochleariae TaxID=80249 RepID=A0A9N9SH03_PHACE|nr:unnamed protein product [Phaedon cochleariae]